MARLLARAAGVAQALDGVVSPGDRVLLPAPQGPETLAAMLGVMARGAASVPLQPPDGPRAGTARARLRGVARDAKPAAILAPAGLVQALADDLVDAPVVDLASVGDGPREVLAAHRATPGEVAWLQYTSGSTSAPKGVRVTHGSLAVNFQTFDVDYAHTPDAVVVSWLPIFHDLGLVYGALLPLWKGIPCVLLEPLAFLQQPSRWVQAIHRHRGTHTAAPELRLRSRGGEDPRPSSVPPSICPACAWPSTAPSPSAGPTRPPSSKPSPGAASPGPCSLTPTGCLRPPR